MLNISNIVLNDDEIELLCKGMSFCPTPIPDINELNDDLYNFTRHLRLKYHFRNSDFEDLSIVKPPSTFTPPSNQNVELETIINKIKHLNVTVKRPSDNIKSLRKALRSLIERTEKREIIIKSADKGDITVIMSPTFYVHMCMNELSKEEFYKLIGSDNPTQRILDVVQNFALKYKSMLTSNEFAYLTQRKYRMANFYMMPNLLKSEYINTVLT